jgi:hypothetical protein
MWSEVDKDELARECWVPTRPSTKQEIEQMVVHVRLWLYNDAAPCGPKAIREALDTEYHAHPLPSERTIARILARNGLTYGRTGWYEGDDPDWLPESAKRWNPYRQNHTYPEEDTTVVEALTRL